MKIDIKYVENIFENLRQQNKSNFEEFYNNYKKLIYGVAFSILKNEDDSEDIVQNVFLKIYNATPDILPSNNQLSWIYVVTKNEALQLYKKRRKLESLDLLYEIPDNKDYILENIDNIEYNRLIRKLPLKQKEVISLKIVGDLTFKEIANLLAESESTIKWRYYKATHSLKLIISNLSLFICTLTLGIHNYINNKRANGTDTIINENNNTITENNSQTNITENITINDKPLTEETTDIDGELKGTLQNSASSESENKNDEELEDINQNTTENTIIDTNDENSQFTGNSTIYFTLSSIFLVLTIIFTIFFNKKPTKIKNKKSK